MGCLWMMTEGFFQPPASCLCYPPSPVLLLLLLLLLCCLLLPQLPQSMHLPYRNSQVSVHALAWLRLLPDCLLGGCAVVAVAIASAAPLPDVSSQCSIVMRPILAELLLRHCGPRSVVCPFYMSDSRFN